MEITLHTGCQIDAMRVNIDWHDENNIHRVVPIDIIIREQDKPRTMEILIDGVVAYIVDSHNRIWRVGG